MIVEKGHFHCAEKYWGAKAPLAPPVPTALQNRIALVDK